ncbi:MAG TPA: aminotransferase class V-fold PLP-dependent enzyme [Pyrinomonadaceae bacterium]|nr:aminotransferase class V-fold PLP-dependent enzyme [Pyrinomonadaceae bacterium]
MRTDERGDDFEVWEGANREEADRGRSFPEEGERAATLDPPSDELTRLAELFHGLAVDYVSSPVAPRVFPPASAERVAEVLRRPLPEEGADFDELADECKWVMRYGRANGHPRMFGYVASPAAPVAVLAEWLAAALNQNVTSWRSAPAATEIERTVVRWLAELIGYAGRGVNEGCGGLLTGGGSAANLAAVFVALRTRAAAEGAGGARSLAQRGLWGAGAPMTLYASDQVHLSVPKAADLLGVGREHVRLVAADGAFRLDVRALREMIEADLRAGLRPFCVVANAGTVSTGAVDPLADAARLARDHGLWLHVDGAYGAPAAAVPEKRELFRGLELADSIALDPHKWLYSPVGVGCLLLREPARARAAFADTGGDYIQIFEEEGEEAFAFWDYGPELSRPFRALKVWAVLRYHGARRVAAAIAEDCALAEHLAELVRASEDFELTAPTTLGICCFRYLTPGARRELEAAADDEQREQANRRLDELNARLLHRLQRGGAAYLSNAVVRGRFTLRASVTNFRTTRRDLAVTLDAVRRAAREEAQTPGP